MYRYVALVWNPENAAAARTSRELLGAVTAQPDWSLARVCPGTIVLHTHSPSTSGRTLQLSGNRGAILGHLFPRGSLEGSAHGQKVSLDEDESEKIVASGCKDLIDGFWGAYVAVIYDACSNAHHILRDPTASLPCYRMQLHGVHVLFARPQDCVHLLDLRFSVNSRYLLRWLIAGRLMARDCGLENVEDLVGGERLTLSLDRSDRSMMWDPTEIAQDALCMSATDTCTALRRTVQHSVDAWASCYDTIVHKLSGGLDSSILAACLAQVPSRPRVTYLNFSLAVGLEEEPLYLPGIEESTARKLRSIAAHGDERYFARLVAEKWRTPLIERGRDPDMDLEQLWRAPLMASPALFFSGMDVDDVEIELATTNQVQAFFSAQAGDSLFFATGQPFSAIDYAYLHGWHGADFWQHVVDSCRLTGESFWSVMAKSIKHGILRRTYKPVFSPLDQPTLLRRDLQAVLTEDDFRVPWAHPSTRLPPGKRNHVEALCGSAYYDFIFHSGLQTDHIDPLNSQPIWELMLRIPTFVASLRGVSRGLARRAFWDELPVEIARRQLKGTGTPFYQRIFRSNRALLRDHLSNGLLVREGYLDPRELEEYFRKDEPFAQVSAVQVLTYLSAEIWLQQLRDPAAGRNRRPSAALSCI